MLTLYSHGLLLRKALDTVCTLFRVVMMPGRLMLPVATRVSRAIASCWVLVYLPALTHGRAVPGRLTL